MELDKMSLKELRDLRGQVDRAITSFEDRRRREAMAAVEEAARTHGFNLNELTGAGTRKKVSVAPKYANPDDPTMTWTGRGRKPRWVLDFLAAGKSLDDLTI